MHLSLSTSALFLLFASAGSAVAQLAWTQVTPANSPGGRYGHAMAYHEARGRMVLFGGANDTVNKLDDTWEFDGTTWQLMSTTVRPPARRWHAMVYSPTFRSVLLFGGDLQSTAGPANDVWVYTSTGRWAELTTVGVEPAGRYGHCATWDSRRQTMVVFGGMTTNVPLQECWELDSGFAWRQFTGTLPPGRMQAGMAFDSHRQVSVLTSGVAGQTHLSDTWEFDGTWRRVSNATSAPLQQISLAYDSVRRRVLFLGGLASNGSAGFTVDSFGEYDGTTWMFRQIPRPSRRTSARAAFDTQLGRTILFGGSTFPGVLGDTWRLESQIPASAVPFGTSCGGATPSLGALAPNDRPWIGSPFGLSVQGLPSIGLVGIYFGASRTSWAGVPLPLDLTFLGMPACQQLVSGDVLVSVAGSGGVGNLTLNVPAQTAFNGQQLFTQAVVLSPAANPAGFVMTNAQTLTLGLR